MDWLRCNAWFLDKYGVLEVRGVTSLRKGTCSTFTTSRIASTKSSYSSFFPEHGTRENNNTYICWAYPCIMHISILDTRCDQKNRVGPGSFPTKHPDAGGNYRTGRCTDGRKVKVLAWLWHMAVLSSHPWWTNCWPSDVFFVFCGNTWLFDVIWIFCSLVIRPKEGKFQKFDAILMPFQFGDVSHLNGAPPP